MRKDKLKIDFSSKSLKANFGAMYFKEGEFDIFFIPSVQISAYGDSKKEAEEMLKISLQQFTEDIFSQTQSKALDILNKLGWKKNTYFKKRMVNLSDTTFADIKKEFNLPDNTPIENVPIAI